MSEQTDPGTGGKKLSKSDSEAHIEARNKSYNKVLDLQAVYVRRLEAGQFDEIPNALARWRNKAEWHEKEFGW